MESNLCSQYPKPMWLTAHERDEQIGRFTIPQRSLDVERAMPNRTVVPVAGIQGLLEYRDPDALTMVQWDNLK